MKNGFVLILLLSVAFFIPLASAAWWQATGNNAYYNPSSNLYGPEFNSTGTSTISLWNGVRVDYAINSSTSIDTDSVRIYFTSSIGSPYSYGDRNISIRVETDDGTGNMSGNLVAPNMTGKLNHSVGFITIPLNSSYLFNGTDGIIHFNISTTGGNSANYFRLQGLNQNTARLKMYKNGSIVSGIPIIRFGNSSEKAGNIYTTYDTNNIFSSIYEGEQFELSQPMTVNQTCAVMKWNTGETAYPRYVLSGLAQGELVNVTNSSAITTSAGSVCFDYDPISLPASDVYTAYFTLQNNVSTSGIAIYRLYTSQIDTYGTWGGAVNIAARFDGTSWTTDDRYDVQMVHNVIGSQGTIPVSYYVSGYVHAHNGSILENVEVSDDITGNSTATDSNGFYNITGLSNASHTIFANLTGFDSNSINVDVNGTNMVNQNITLYESVVPTPPQNGSGVVLTMAMRKTTAYGSGGNWRLQVRNQSGYLFYDYNAKNITGFTAGLVGGTLFSMNLTGIQLGSDSLKIQIWGNRTSYGGALFQFFDINVTKDGIPLRYSLTGGDSSNADWYYRVVTDDAGVIKMGTVSLTQDRYAELQTSIISEAPELKVSPMSIALGPDVFNTTVGSNVFVTTTVWNLGNISESAAVLKLYVNDSLVQTSSSFAVARLANTTRVLNFTLTGKPTTVRVQVVPSDSNIEGNEKNNNVTIMILQRHPNVWVTNVSDLPIKKYGSQEPYISWNATIITNANSKLSTKFGTTRGFNSKVGDIEALALGYMMTNKSSYAEVAIQGFTNITCTCTTFGTSDVNAPYVGISTYGAGSLGRSFDYLGNYIYQKDQNLYRSIQKNLSIIMYYNAMYVKATTFYETGETVNRFVLDGDSAAFQQNTGMPLTFVLLDQNSSDIDAYQEMQDMKGAYFDRHYLGMNTEKNIFASTVYGDGWKPEANYRKYIARFTYAWMHGYQNLFGTLYDEYPIAKGFVMAPMYTSGLWGQKPQYGAGSNEVYTETYSIPALLTGVEQQYAQWLPTNFANADSWWINVETDKFFKEKEYNMEDLRQIYYNNSIAPLPPKFKNTYGYDFSYVNGSNGLAILRSGWNPDDLWCGFKAYYVTRSGGHHSGDGGMGLDCSMDGAYIIGDAGDNRGAYGSGESNASLRKYGSIANGFIGESSLVIDGGTYTKGNKAYINTSFLGEDFDFVEGEAVVAYYRANGLTTGSETESTVASPPNWNRSLFMIAGDYFIMTDRMTSTASHSYSQALAFGGTNFYDAGTSTFENDTFIGNITMNGTTPFDWFNNTQSFGEVSKVTWDTPKEKNYNMTSTATIELNVYLIPQTTVTIDKSLLNWGRSYGYDAWRPHMMSAQSGTNVKYLTIMHPRNQTGNEVNITVMNLTVSGGAVNDYAAKIKNGSKMDEITISDGATITTSGNHTTDAMQSFSRYDGALKYYFLRNGSRFNYSTTDHFLADKRVIYAHVNYSGNNQTVKISGSNGTNITLKVSDTASNYSVKRNGVTYTNFGVKDASHVWINMSLSEAMYDLLASQEQGEPPAGTSIPSAPVNLTNTTGAFWVNHTWQAGTGNVTNSYNVSVNGTWTNSTATYKNTTGINPHGWANITVYSYNSSGNGSLSIGQNISQLGTPGSVSSLLLYGQTFTVTSGSALDTISIYGNLSGTRAITIYNSPSKSVTYGSASTTGPSSDAWNTWNFSSLGLGNGSYYYEFLAEKVFRNNVDSYSGGDLYVDGSIWSGQDMTFMINMSAGVSMNTQVPNNAPVLGAIGNKNVVAGQWLNFTTSSTDADGDTITNATNATKGSYNITTGAYSWLPTSGDIGTYNWKFNSTDVYGGEDNETITVNVIAVTIPSINFVPSNNTHFKNLSYNQTNSLTYVPLLNISLIGLPISGNGTVNFTFDMKSVGGTATKYAQLQKNGINIGAEITDGSSSYVTKTQFISTQLNSTDTISLLGRRQVIGESINVTRFSISYDGYFNLTSGNTTLAVRTTNLSYLIQRSNSTITENDGNQSTAHFISQVENGKLESSIDYSVGILSNTSTEVSVMYNTSAGNETLIFNATTVNVSRILNVTNTTKLVVYEQVIPLLTDTRNDSIYPRYDLVWLNKTLAANDIKMWAPYIVKDGDVSGIHTRYARYDSDFGVIVSSRNWNQYFKIILSGTSSLMANASARQAGNTNLTQSKYNKFHLGFINRTAYNYTDLNNPEASVPITSGTTIYQNVSYEFYDNSIDWISGKMLPDGNPIVNFTRFTDLNEFPNQTIGKEARFAATALMAERLYSLYYPNETAPGYPAIYDSANTYNSFTNPSASRFVQGAYYFANSSGKQVMRLWMDGIVNWNEYYKTYPMSNFEAENFTNYATSPGWIKYYDGAAGYSQNNIVYSDGGAPLQINITGDQFIIYFDRYTDRGIANISVNNGANVSFDTYAAAGQTWSNPGSQYTSSSGYSYNPGKNPSNGILNIKIYVSGTKNTSSTGNRIAVDKIGVRRNDTGDQMFGWLQRNDAGLDSGVKTMATAFDSPPLGTQEPYFHEKWNVTINDTTYPYNISLYPSSNSQRGATAFGLEFPPALYTIYKTDGMDTWLENKLLRTDRVMLWLQGMYIEPSTNMWRNDKLLMESAYHDNIMSSGYRGSEGSMFVLDADIMALLWGAPSNITSGTKQTYWVNSRDVVKTQIIKDISNGGVWKNETVGGHFIDSLEPGPVRREAENLDVLNRENWTLFEDNNVQAGGGYISGRRWRPWNSTQDTMSSGNGSSGYGFNPAHRYLYYIDNSSYPIIFHFNGTGISVVNLKTTNAGFMNVSVDGGANTTIDLYKSAATGNVTTLINNSLPWGNHNIRLYWTGTKNASSSGTYVNIDAFEVYNDSIPGGQMYSFNAFTLNLFPDWYKQELIKWIQWHEGNGTHDGGQKIYTDWLYPFVPPNIQDDYILGGVEAWGYHLTQTIGDWAYYGFENGGHFPGSGAFVSRLTGNYSDMQWYGFGNGDFKKKYSLRESYYPNGDDSVLIGRNGTYTNALYQAGLAAETVYEDQMSGMWLTGYASIWGASYAAASDTTPPATITGLTNTTSQASINWSWTNPSDIDFDHAEIYINSIFATNTSNPYFNISIVPPNTSTISTRTADLTGNVNQTWVNQTTTVSAIYNRSAGQSIIIASSVEVMKIEPALSITNTSQTISIAQNVGVTKITGATTYTANLSQAIAVSSGVEVSRIFERRVNQAFVIQDTINATYTANITTVTIFVNQGIVMSSSVARTAEYTREAIQSVNIEDFVFRSKSVIVNVSQSVVFTGTASINKSTLTDFTISCLVGWCYLAMNYSNKTLLQLDNLFTSDNTQGWYNATSQKYESHRTGYKVNENVSIPQKWGYYYYFLTAQNVNVSINSNVTITLKPGWNLVGNDNSTVRTLGELKTSIGSNATGAQYYNRTSKTWETSDSTRVPAGEAFFVFVNASTSWRG